MPATSSLSSAHLSELFTPYDLNEQIRLPNRILLAPCTRNRADEHLAPSKGALEHYAGRSEGGLLITEATIIARHVQGYPDTPGIYTPHQVDKWAQVVEAVHARGGLIFSQLWHPGRMGHSYYSGSTPLAPSAVHDNAKRRGVRHLDMNNEMPVAMSEEDVEASISQYAHAAKCAKAAGFDGIEIHGANGYLPEQFLRMHTNRRDDMWGGTAVNRARYLVSVTDAIAAEIGYGRVGVRVSPAAYFSDMRYTEGDNEALLEALAELSKRPIAYVHTGIVDDMHYEYLHGTSTEFLRRHWPGTLVANGGYRPERAAAGVRDGEFDLVSFGKLFLANADLVDRLRTGRDLEPYGRHVIDAFV